MAIKGKGRSKRRGIATPPKPVYVQPKRPFYARRRVQVAFALVVGVGAIAGVVTGLLVQHHNNQKKALRATESSIVDRFGHAMDNDLSGVGQPFQTQFQPFPDLTSDVTNFKSGQLTAAKAKSEGSKWSRAAADAASGIRAIQTAQMIEGHADLVDLSDAQNLVVDALGVYRNAADALKLAAQATGGLRTQLIAHAQSLVTTASQIFNNGYQKLINERQRFGLLAPVNPTQQAGLPTPSPATSAPAASGSGGGSKGSTSSGKHKKKS